ncbi:MAG: hypothetical protein GQ476_06270 [Candidatus Aminicenantes bacterium]|nr:hypothetical protein [Candidatus Aminicenantes bacterium]
MQFSKKEKLRLFLFIVLLFFLFNLNINSVPGQEKLQEEVTVTALEVPVRVIHKGQVVKGLTKEDFEIYENGVKQEITNFEVITRKISIPQEERKAHQKKRLFLLIFNIFDYSETVGEGIDYFFQNVFQQGDRFIVLTEGRLLDIKSGNNISEVILNLKETLKKFKIISNQHTLKIFRDLRFESDKLIGMLQGYEQSAYAPLDQAMIRFFDNYKIAWFDYRKQYLVPNLELYRNIIKRIKQIEGERWTICFQQREMFPQLKKAGRLDNEIRNWVDSQVDSTAQVKARLVQVKQQELQRTFDVSRNFPADGLRDLFMEANITFHLILLKSFRTVFSRDFDLREITSDYENCFKNISLLTGGSSAFSNKISEALKEATEKEDYYYLLVYSPKENQSVKKRDIEVKVKKSGVNLVYLKHVPEKGAPLITITNFKAGKKNIKFSLINYKMTKIEGKLTGMADIKITIFDENSNKVFDEGKTLNLIKKETFVSLNFNWLKSGSYFIIIQVNDRISQETDVFSRNIKF